MSGSRETALAGRVVHRQRRWALLPVALVLTATSVPFLWTHGAPVVGLALNRGFALVCNQRPGRSFLVFGAPVAVCARCLGIYTGSAIGLLLRTSRQLALRILTAAVTINAIDAVTEYAGWHGNWMAVRFALGVGLGVAGATVISSATARISFSPE